jgi:hypothetical protein
VEITHPVDQTVIFGTLKHLFDKFGALTPTDTLSLSSAVKFALWGLLFASLLSFMARALPNCRVNDTFFLPIAQNIQLV